MPSGMLFKSTKRDIRNADNTHVTNETEDISNSETTDKLETVTSAPVEYGKIVPELPELP